MNERTIGDLGARLREIQHEANAMRGHPTQEPIDIDALFDHLEILIGILDGFDSTILYPRSTRKEIRHARLYLLTTKALFKSMPTEARRDRSDRAASTEAEAQAEVMSKPAGSVLATV